MRSGTKVSSNGVEKFKRRGRADALIFCVFYKFQLWCEIPLILPKSEGFGREKGQKEATKKPNAFTME